MGQRLPGQPGDQAGGPGAAGAVQPGPPERGPAGGGDGGQAALQRRRAGLGDGGGRGVGAAGLVAYYQALAVGQTAIVAPLASTGAVLPLLVDLARGERPGPVALGGLLLVLGGIVVTSLASGERDEPAPAPTWHGPPATRRRVAVPRPPVPILLALVAAVLFGLFLDRKST